MVINIHIINRILQEKLGLNNTAQLPLKAVLSIVKKKSSVPNGGSVELLNAEACKRESR